MKAIILSAGRGSRLHPLTRETPKCLIEVEGARPLLQSQLEVLVDCGIDEAVVVVGFGADQVQAFLARDPVPGIRVRTRFNPFYEISGNLMSCWLMAEEMQEDFLLLDGDRLWEPALLDVLLDAPHAPITLAVNEKAEYAADDLRISVGNGQRLLAVGRGLVERVEGESVGLSVFRGEGPKVFQGALEKAAHDPEGLSSGYLSVIDSLARWLSIRTEPVTGLWWGRVDTHENLADVRAGLNPPPDSTPIPVSYCNHETPVAVRL